MDYFDRDLLPAFAHFDLERQADELQATTDIELFLRNTLASSASTRPSGFPSCSLHSAAPFTAHDLEVRVPWVDRWW